MAGNAGNLELALRIQADLGEATQQLAALEKSLDRLAAGGRTGAKGLDAAGTAADAAATAIGKVDGKATSTATALDKVGAAGKSAAAGLKEVGNASGAAGKNAASLAPAVGKNGTAMQSAAKTAGELKQAYRQLPAQMTDIMVGLTTGQPVWMVAIQQGGQLKDSFGGIVPAAKAVVGAISPMAVGLGAGASALGAIAMAAYQGYQEIRGYETALISTGNISGTTAGAIADMADAVGEASGEYSGAEQAAQQLAAAGVGAAVNLKTATQAAVDLAKLTGDSIESTTDKVIKLAEAPTAMLEKLNSQYHFLTTSVYEHVRALEDQGNAEDAARVAVEEFGRVHAQRVKEAEERAGYLEQAWNGLGKTIKGVWNDLKDIGRTDPEARLAVAQAQLAKLRAQAPAGGNALWDGQIKRTEAAVAALQKEVDAQKSAAKAQADARLVQDKGVSAASAISKGLDQGASKAEKLSKAVTELKKQFQELRAANPGSDLLKGVTFGADGNISGGAYAKRVKQLQEQYKEAKKPKGPKTEAQKDEEAAQRELESLRQQITLTNTLTATERKATEESRIRAAIADGDYKHASAATKARLIDEAKLLDQAKLRQDADVQILDVHQRIAALQGNKVDAELEKTTAELGKLKTELEGMGRTQDAADVTKLLNLSQASAQLTGLKKTYDQTMGEIAIEVQRIQAEQQVGLITESQAQQKIVDLYQAKLGTLKALVPQMRAAAESLGDKDALANVEQIAIKLQEMEATTNRLQSTFTGTFKDSLSDVISTLATGTATLTEAVGNFFQSMAKGIVDFYAKDWSERAGNWLNGKLGNWLGSDTAAADGGDAAGATAIASAGTAAASAITVAGNTVAAAISAAASGGVGIGAAGTDASIGIGAGVEQAAGALDQSGSTVISGAQALTGSATQLATAVGGLSPGASAIINAAVQLFTAAQAMQASNAVSGVASSFAVGGFTGFGGRFDPAGIVHRGEGVLSAPEITAIGGPAGFNALRAAIRGRGFADGGLPGFSMPAANDGAFRPASGTGGSRTLDQRLRVVMVDDPERIPRALMGESGEKSFLYHAGRNKGELRNLLGLD